MLRIEDGFRVAVPRPVAWDLLMDVPRVVPCLPGAELVETVAEDRWKALMRVKLGPIGLEFATDVHRESADPDEGVVRLVVAARDVKGRGRASAVVVSRVDEDASGTNVALDADVTLTGPVAQYGRGVVQDVSAEMVRQFAANLEAEATRSAAEAPAPAPARPVSGFRLALLALLRRLRLR